MHFTHNLILTRLLNNLKLLIIVAYKFGSSFVFPTPIVRKEKRLKEVMAAEVPVSLLWIKLKKMRDEERFVFPGLRNRVVTAVNELEKILCLLKASKPNHEIISISPQETSLIRSTSGNLPETALLHTIYSAEHFTESFLLQRRRKGVIQIEMPLVFSPWTQLWFSFKMMKLVQGVRAVSREFGKTQGQPTVDNTALRDGREIHAGQRCRHLVGELVARLINDNEASLRVISLVREEVLGEEICFTTLAREVYDRLDIQQHFRSRAWLNASRDLEYKDLLLALLKQLPSYVMNDLEHMSEKELCAMLFQFLMEDRFLIVLDDVQTVDVWLKLVRPFADAVNGSRVILTTHNIDVAKQADPWSSPLEPSPMIEQEPDAIVDGHEAEVKELLSRLINHNDDSLRVISVLGNEAVGKTTLVRNVYNRLDIRQRFPRRAWLHVSGDLAYKDLLLIILKQLPTRELKDLELMREEELC